jgi:hypothetical protein
MAQSEASDKLMKQAEQHREALEKEFKQNMKRMKAEHDRAINEAMKIRDDYARSAQEAACAVNQTIQRIDQVQSDKLVNFPILVTNILGGFVSSKVNISCINN